MPRPVILNPPAARFALSALLAPSVLLVKVCTSSLPTIALVVSLAMAAASCARDSVKSRADTPCSTAAPIACAFAPELSMFM